MRTLLAFERGGFDQRSPLFHLGGLEDDRPRPGQVWNRIPDDIRAKAVQLALGEPTLSPRELATRFTDAVLRLGIFGLSPPQGVNRRPNFTLDRRDS